MLAVATGLLRVTGDLCHSHPPERLACRQGEEALGGELGELCVRRRSRPSNAGQSATLVGLDESAYADDGYLTPREVLARVRAAGISTPSDSVRIIRASREGRNTRRRR